MQAGKLIREIDQEDIYEHLELTVYMAKREYYETLSKLDETNY